LLAEALQLAGDPLQLADRLDRRAQLRLIIQAAVALLL